MIRLYSIVFLLTINHLLYSQQTSKSLVDTGALQNWPTIEYGKCIISNDGKYVGYVINNGVMSLEREPIIILKNINNSWESKIGNGILNSAKFSEDSKHLVVLLRGKKLYMSELGTTKMKIIDDVQSFKLKTVAKEQYLIIGKRTELLVLNLTTGQERRFAGITHYLVAEESSTIAFTRQTNIEYSISLLRLQEKSEILLWKGEKAPSHLVMDKSGSHIAFMSDTSLIKWDGDYNMKVQAITFSDDKDCKHLTLEGPDRFSPSGKFLFVKMLGEPVKSLNPEVNPVQVFSYQDPNFHIDASKSQSTYTCLYELATGRLIRLEYDHDIVGTLSSDEKSILITHTEANVLDGYWNRKGISQSRILFLDDEKEVQIPQSILRCKMSPSGKWIMGYDNLGKDIMFYNVQKRQIINLTVNLPISPLAEAVEESTETKNISEVSEYTLSADERSVIVCEHYDIWRIDLEGSKPAENLTNGYGRKHNVQFRFYQQDEKPTINDGNIIVITAFNEETKDNGFFKLRVGSHKDPEVLTMGRYFYCALDQNAPSSIPVKARDKDIWIVRRMSATESPNYFWTKDFKNFNPISNIFPEKNYQWHTTELVNYTTKDGVKSQAILYKPEDFDDSKKYPVLFNFYERETAKLNVYLQPEYFSTYYFNIPIMVGRGYLVCVVDIHFKLGQTAHNIVDCVEGAAAEISKRHYVDSRHFGASGGSFGGYGVNCLASFSDKFAALVPISGGSDLISMYGNFPGLAAEEVENRQFGMGVSLSTDPERYLYNSPVAYAKNVKTPVLIVNTLMDWNVNPQQGIEWFVSLRREGKRAWMLRYQNNGHGIGELNDQIDLYTRINQFFDHYLKGAPAPVWMTRGISVNDTGIRTGFEYDTEIKTPEPSKLLIER